MAKDRKKGSFGFLGIDPTLGLGDKVLDHIKHALDEEEKRVQKSDYYAFCPGCGKKQIKENLLEDGCFVCGWKGTEKELELAQAKKGSSSLPRGGNKLESKSLCYKMKCPHCGASVVTEQFLQNGCWRCGYKEHKEDLTRLIEVLDEKSRAILWHLWWHRHAEISELRDIIDAPTDFEVLHRLKDVINEKAQRLFGKPIVGFEQSKIDPISGQKVLFNWWLLDEGNISPREGNKPLVDVFNEKDSIIIIAQVPSSVDLSQPEISYKNGILRLKLRKGCHDREEESGR